MFKRIVAILLLLACLLPTAAGALDIRKIMAASTTIPSLDAYMGKYASAGKTQTKDYLIYRKYSGKPSNIAAIAGNYVKLLDEEYGFEVIEELWMDFGTYARVTYALTRSSSSSLSSFYISNADDEPYWRTESANVILQYTVPDSGSAYIHFYYAPELTYKNNGDYYYPANKSTTTYKDTDSSATK